MGAALALACAGLAGGCAQSFGGVPLPDLATQSPSKQQVMSPSDQKKAIDELIAKREQQTAEAARAAQAEQARR